MQTPGEGGGVEAGRSPRPPGGVPVFGCDREEWGDLARWMHTHDLYTNNGQAAEGKEEGALRLHAAS